MVAAAARGKAKLAVAHQTRYHPLLAIVKGMLDVGDLGRVLEFRGRGKEDGRGGGEDLWVLGSHVMNLIHFLGGAPASCTATVRQEGKPVDRSHVKEGNEGIGALAGDQLQATYAMASGATAFFASTRGAGGGKGRFGLQVFGSKGVVEVMTGYPPEVRLLEDPAWSPGRSGAPWKAVEPAPGATGLHAGNVAAVNDLIEAIEKDRAPLCGIEAARMTVEMIAAVFESHREGRPVQLPLENRENPLRSL
jgi:predicted dehydrogenase